MPRYKTIKIKEEAVLDIAEDAIRGYRVPYKQERMGFLLGYLKGPVVYEGIPYRGGEKTRTQIVFDRIKLFERGNELAMQRKKKVIGLYHTHPEQGGERCYTLSEEDKDSFLANPYLVEMVVAVGPNLVETDFEIHYNQDGSLTMRYSNHYLRYTIFYKRENKVKKGIIKIVP